MPLGVGVEPTVHGKRRDIELVLTIKENHKQKNFEKASNGGFQYCEHKNYFLMDDFAKRQQLLNFKLYIQTHTHAVYIHM